VVAIRRLYKTQQYIKRYVDINSVYIGQTVYTLSYMEEIYMKLEVYDKCKKADDVPNKLKLGDVISDDIGLMLVKDDGTCAYSGNLLRINKHTGKITRIRGVNRHVGFDLDSVGRLNIDE